MTVIDRHIQFEKDYNEYTRYLSNLRSCISYLLNQIDFKLENLFIFINYKETIKLYSINQF